VILTTQIYRDARSTECQKYRRLFENLKLWLMEFLAVIETEYLSAYNYKPARFFRTLIQTAN
jgi:hypothetical protein